jgi:hypothetical protein
LKYGVKSANAPPAAIKTIIIPSIPLTVQASLMANLPEPLSISQLAFFEHDSIAMYHQGIIVYETLLPSKKNYTFKLMANDYAMLFVDGEMAGSIVRKRYENKSLTVECKREGCVLRVLV